MKLSQQLAAAATLAAALCALPARADGERIAYFTKNLTNPYFQVLRQGADLAAKQNNATIQHYIPTKPDNILEQMSQIEDAVVKKPSAIVLMPVDRKAMVAGVAKINAARIPVVNVTDRAAGGEFVSFVGADDYVLGVETGRFLLKALGGKGNVVIIEGVKGAGTSVDRVRGFHKALEEFPNVKLLASQPGNYQRLQALQVMENLMQSFPQIDGVLAANDAMAIGAIEALDSANRKALVIGINGNPESIQAIKAGKLLATGAFPGFTQGCISTMAALRYVRHQPVPKEIIFPPAVVHAGNTQDWEVPVEKRTCPKWEDVVKQ